MTKSEKVSSDTAWLRSAFMGVQEKLVLDLKLASPPSFTDDRPGAAVDVPSAPGRPRWMPMVASKPIPPAPTPAGLENVVLFKDMSYDRIQAYRKEETKRESRSRRKFNYRSIRKRKRT